MCIYYLHNNYPNNLQIAKYGDFLLEREFIIQEILNCSM